MARKLIICLLGVFALFFGIEASAQKIRIKSNRKVVKVVRPYKVAHRHGVRRNFIVVKPRRFSTIKVLPAGYSTVVFRRRNYFYQNGYFYRHIGGNYMLIAPPAGMRIKLLHPNRRVIIIGGAPCYYHMGVCYKEVGTEYEVVEQPVGTVVPDLPEDSVEQVKVGEETYYKVDNRLYKANNNQYELVEKL